MMKNFNYYIPTRILFGAGQLNELHKQQLPGKKALVVISAGKSVRKYGYLDRLLAQLDLAGVSYAIYDKVQANPTKDGVMEAAALARQEKCDYVIGLGGGSADAAFMLKMLNEEFKLGLSPEELQQKASLLGADCAFFVENKPTLAKGIGNIFEPTEVNLEGYHIVLVKPDVHVSTAEAYGGCKPQRWTTPLETAIKRPIAEWKNCIFNDFEKTVFVAHPELAEIKKMLYDKGAIYAAMSGSGSTIYGIFDKEVSDINTHIDSKIYKFQLK